MYYETFKSLETTLFYIYNISNKNSKLVILTTLIVLMLIKFSIFIFFSETNMQDLS